MKLRSTCPNCGEVEQSPDYFVVHVCDLARASFYSFTCPLCQKYLCNSADSHVIAILIHAGVEARTWTVPAEMQERLQERHEERPLVLDDLIDLHFELENA